MNDKLQNSDLYKLFILFKREDIEAFKDSMYYNDSRKSKEKKLFDYLVENQENPNDEAAYTTIFEREKYKYATLKELISSLFKLLKNNLADRYNSEIDKSFEIELALAKFYNHKKDKTRLASKIKSIKESNKKKNKDEEYYKNEVKIYKFLNTSIVANKEKDRYIGQIIQQLDFEYFINTLEYSAAAFSRKRQVIIDGENDFRIQSIEALKKMKIELNINEQHAVIDIYLELIELFNDNQALTSTQEFNKEMERVKNIEKNIEDGYKENSISMEKKLEFQTYLRNYITEKFNLGGKFTQNYLELIFKKQKNIFEQLKLQGEDLPPLFYLNLNTTGLRTGKSKWIKKHLLDCYKEGKIQESMPENKAIYDFNLALYYLYTNQLAECDLLFSGIKDSFGKNYNYKLAYYRLGIKLFFETQDIIQYQDILETKQNNFKQFMSDTRLVLADNIRKPNLEFCNITARLSKCIYNAKKFAILKEIETTTKPIADKEWLIYIIEKSYNLENFRQNIIKNYELSNYQKVISLCTSLKSRINHNLSKKTKEENENFLIAVNDLIIFKDNPESIAVPLLSTDKEWLTIQKKVLEIKKYFKQNKQKTIDLCNEISILMEDANFEPFPYHQFVNAVVELINETKTSRHLSLHTDVIEQTWLLEQVGSFQEMQMEL